MRKNIFRTNQAHTTVLKTAFDVNIVSAVKIMVVSIWLSVCFSKVSKKLAQRPDWSSNSDFPTSISIRFVLGSPPVGATSQTREIESL